MPESSTGQDSERIAKDEREEEKKNRVLKQTTTIAQSANKYSH